MWTRRQFLSRSAVGVLGVTGSALAFQGDGGKRVPLPDGNQSRGMVTEAAEKAIARGLDYLAARQGAGGEWGTGGYPANVAVTSLAALAMMAGGSMPDRGKYGGNIRRALDFVLQQGERGRAFGNAHPPGFLHNAGHLGQQGPMYSHGFGTLFLGEVCGMVADRVLAERVHTGLTKAVQVIVRAQNNEGGWRYNPIPFDADISVTVCQMMALRSARNAGAFVPASVARRCIEYVKRCWTQGGGNGSYVYQASNPRFAFPGQGGGFARTAAGVAALYSAGIYQGPEIDSGLNFLLANRPQRIGPQADMHYFYGHYYAVQAMWTAGGDYWSGWYPKVRDELVRFQVNDGSWSDLLCTHYGTAMACIILQVPNNYLPILQK